MKRRGFLALAAGVALGLRGLPATEPSALVWPEGTFMVDGGTLDLGIVRDSVLIPRNDFYVFQETFENAGFVTTAAPTALLASNGADA